MKFSLLALVFVVAASASVGLVSVSAGDACHLVDGVCTLKRYEQCFRRMNLVVPGVCSTPTGTGAFLTGGTDVVLQAIGLVQYFAGQGESCQTNADGNINRADDVCSSGQCALVGGQRGLLYRIGTAGPWTLAGSAIRVHDGALNAPAKELFLLYNDDYYGDNTGAFTVDIQQCDEEPTDTPAPFALTTAWNIVDSVDVVNVQGISAAPTNAGFGLDANTEVVLSARGLVQFAPPCGPTCTTNPHHPTVLASLPCATNPTPNSPQCALEGAEVGVLLYRLGETDPWSVAGASTVIRGTGQHKRDLYLVVNDNQYDDNTGSYVVTLTHLRERCPQSSCATPARR